MKAQKSLQQLLEAKGFDVAEDTLSGLYNEGRIYVLAGSFSSVEAITRLTAVCAIEPGHDIVDLTRRVMEAINDSKDFYAPDVTFGYGAPPIPGRQMDVADSSAISVVSGIGFDDA